MGGSLKLRSIVIGCGATGQRLTGASDPKSNDVMASWQERAESYGDGVWRRLTCGLVTIKLR